MARQERHTAESEREVASSGTPQELLRATHDALDVLESSLRALASFEKPVSIDLVLQLRRRVIEAFSDARPDGS